MGGIVGTRTAILAIAALMSCTPAAAVPTEPQRAARWDSLLQSRTDAKGATTYWGAEATYEIVGPGMTAFLLRRDDGAVGPPMIRVAYVSDSWINVRSVTFTVGERTYGPYTDIYDTPGRIKVDASTVVETLLFPIDSEEKWRMVEGIGEADELGRPVILVFDGDTRYGVELDRATKRATGSVVRAFRKLQAN